MRKGLAAFLLLHGIYLSLPPSVSGDEPSATEIQQRIQKLDSSNAKTKSFEIRGNVFISDGLEFSVIIAHRKPDDWLVKICDARDETPVVWMRNREMIFYAPGNASVYLCNEARFDFKMDEGKDAVGLNVGFGSGRQPSQFEFNPLLFFGNLKTSEVKHLQEQTYELLLTSNNNSRAVLVADLSRDQVLQKFDFRPESSTKSVLAIKSIRWNEDVPDHIFTFPDMAELSRATKIEDLKFNSPAEVYAFLGRIAQAVLIRMGIERPASRQQLAVKPKLDWETLQASDRRISALLRGEAIDLEHRESPPEAAELEPQRPAGRKPRRRS